MLTIQSAVLKTALAGLRDHKTKFGYILGEKESETLIAAEPKVEYLKSK